MQKLMGSGEGVAYLKVLNRSTVPVWLAGISVRPNQFQVAKDDSVLSIANAASGRDFELLLQPGDHRLFPLMAVSEHKGSEQRSWISVRWRHMRRLWQPQIPAGLVLRQLRLSGW